MTRSYKCPNCAANLTFDPDARKMVCKYCGAEVHPKDIKDPRRNESKPLEDLWEDETEIYTCDSCGAEVIVGKNLSASFCAFCGSPAIISSHFTGGTRPSMIIPFRYGRDEAEKEFRKWCAKKIFLPHKFKARATIEKLTPMYVPFWLYDYLVDVDMVIKNYTSREVEGSDSEMISAVECRKRGPLLWEKIPIVASAEMDDLALEMIEPFNYSKAEPFDMKYMAGFFAQRCAHSYKETAVKVTERLRDYAKDAVMESFSDEYIPISAEDSSYYGIPESEYAMLPVWFLSYKHGKRKYVFLLNGQTGSVAGEIPVSPIRVGLLAVGLFTMIAPVLYFLGGLLL
ncbi:MAG: hypothetical protein JW780_07735 [Clostridiales bacterium]|nr:hypothetical protein [Clostridiales bacterium]